MAKAGEKPARGLVARIVKDLLSTTPRGAALVWLLGKGAGAIRRLSAPGESGKERVETEDLVGRVEGRAKEVREVFRALDPKLEGEPLRRALEGPHVQSDPVWDAIAALAEADEEIPAGPKRAEKLLRVYAGLVTGPWRLAREAARAAGAEEPLAAFFDAERAFDAQALAAAGPKKRYRARAGADAVVIEDAKGREVVYPLEVFEAKLRALQKDLAALGKGFFAYALDAINAEKAPARASLPPRGRGR